MQAVAASYASVVRYTPGRRPRLVAIPDEPQNGNAVATRGLQRRSAALEGRNRCQWGAGYAHRMVPTDSAQAALDRLRDPDAVALVSGRFAITLLIAFGSAVRSQHAADLDLAVLADGRLDVLALMEALYQVTGYERIDVLDLRRADVVARVQALQHGEALYESHPGVHNEQLVQALALYWDTQWLRDLELEALAR